MTNQVSVPWDSCCVHKVKRKISKCKFDEWIASNLINWNLLFYAKVISLVCSLNWINATCRKLNHIQMCWSHMYIYIYNEIIWSVSNLSKKIKITENDLLITADDDLKAISHVIPNPTDATKHTSRKDRGIFKCKLLVGTKQKRAVSTSTQQLKSRHSSCNCKPVLSQLFKWRDRRAMSLQLWDPLQRRSVYCSSWWP